jgi:hypothetical protein
MFDAYGSTAYCAPNGGDTTGSKQVHTRSGHRLHVVQPTRGHQREVGVPMWRGAI